MNKYKCTECNKQFPSERGLKIHITRLHKKQQNNDTTKKGELPSPTKPNVTSFTTVNVPMVSSNSSKEDAQMTMVDKVMMTIFTKFAERDERRYEMERLRDEKRCEEERLRREEERRQREMERKEDREERRAEREEDRLQRQMEREEDYRLRQKDREEERRIRQIEREEERCIRQIEREEERRFLLQCEEKKDKRWFEYCRIQEKAIDGWKETMDRELDMREKFLEQREKTYIQINQRNRVLSIGDVTLHQQDEMVVYGTVASPRFTSSDVKNYCRRNVFDNPPFGFDPVIECFEEVIDACSFEDAYDDVPMSFDATTREAKKDTFIEMLQLEDLNEKVESVIDMDSTQYIDYYLSNTTCHMPYDHPEKNWRRQRDLIKTSYPALPSTESHNMGFQKVVTLADEVKASTSIEIVDIVHPEEESESYRKDDYHFTNVENLTKENVVGSADETVSSTKYRKQCTNRFIRQLQVFLDSYPRKKPWLQKRWAILSGRLFICLDRIYKTGVYTPDALVRYMQDARFKVMNPGIEPESRRFFKQRFFKDKKYAKCECCGVKLSVDEEDFDRSHVVPSKKGTIGSNGKHNFMLCCSACNYKMGDLDPMLYPGYNFKRARALLTQTVM